MVCFKKMESICKRVMMAKNNFYEENTHDVCFKTFLTHMCVCILIRKFMYKSFYGNSSSCLFKFFLSMKNFPI